MKKITEIKEKVELKDLEVQADPCKGASQGGTISCEYDCCEDCFTDGKHTSFNSSKY